MGAEQYYGLAKRPYYGLDYEAMVRALARNLPAAYAQKYEMDAQAERERQLAEAESLQKKGQGLSGLQDSLSNLLSLGQTGYSLYKYLKPGKTPTPTTSDGGTSPSLIDSLGEKAKAVGQGVKDFFLGPDISTEFGSSMGGIESTANFVPDSVGLNINPEIFGQSVSQNAPFDFMSPDALTGAGEVASEMLPGLASESISGSIAPSIAPEISTSIPGMSGVDAALIDKAGAGLAEGIEGAAAAKGPAAGSSFLGTAASVVAYIAAAEIVRGLWGQPEKKWDDKGDAAKIFDSPVTAGAIASVIPGSLFSKEGTTGYHIYKGMSAVERTAMAPIDWLFGDKNAFSKEKLNTAFDFLLNPFGHQKSKGAMVANWIFNPLGAVASLFCFVAGTPIDMADGSVKCVEDIDIFDECAIGLTVTGIGKILSEDVYEYKDVKVSGSHAVYENGKWIRVRDSVHAIPVHSDKYITLYAVNNLKHILIVKGVTFSDYGEVDNSEGMTADERLAYLNEYRKI